jgi:hypothetical protein
VAAIEQKVEIKHSEALEHKVETKKTEPVAAIEQKVEIIHTERLNPNPYHSLNHV